MAPRSLVSRVVTCGRWCVVPRTLIRARTWAVGDFRTMCLVGMPAKTPDVFFVTMLLLIKTPLSILYRLFSIM